jgi:hypothetical protein
MRSCDPQLAPGLERDENRARMLDPEQLRRRPPLAPPFAAVRAAVTVVRRSSRDLWPRSIGPWVNPAGTSQHWLATPFLFQRPPVSFVLLLGPSTVQKPLGFSPFFMLKPLHLV